MNKSKSSRHLRSWDWAHTALASSTPTGIRLNMVDTIIFTPPHQMIWLYTHLKSGRIVKRKETAVDTLAIRDRFIQLAASRPSECSFLAYVLLADGTRKLLQPSDFQDFLDEIDQKTSRVLGFQAFVPSQRQPQCCFHVVIDPLESHFQVECLEGFVSLSSSSVIPTDIVPGTRKNLEKGSQLIVQTIQEKVPDLDIRSIRLEFVQDAEQTLWLTHIAHVETIDKTMRALPQSQSLPSLSTTHAMTEANVKKCRGTFCHMAPSSLPGLFPPIANENNALTEENGVERAIPDTGMRFKLAYNNVLLAQAELPFLRGEITGLNASLQWQEADLKLRNEFGRTQPTQFYKNVSVCANCHRIYDRLQKQRAKGFPMPKTGFQTVEKPLKPQQDEDSYYYDQLFLKELAKHSTESVSTPESTRSREENEPEAHVLPSLKTSSVASSIVPQKTIKLMPKQPNNRPSSDKITPRSTNEAVNGKLSALEAEITQLHDQNRQLIAQKTALEHQVVQTTAQCTKALQEKDDQVRKQLKEQEQKLYASFKRSTDTPTTNTADLTQLIESMDALQAHVTQLQQENQTIRYQLTTVHQQELVKVREKHQLELEYVRKNEQLLKETIENLETQLSKAQTQAQSAMAQAKNAKQTLDDLLQTRVLTLEERNRALERQVTDLKAQAMHPKPSEDKHAIETVEKHWSHKVEYLKAQLASEMKCKEEMGAHVMQLTQTIDQLKKDKKSALADHEQTFKRQFEQAEAQFQQEKDVFATQQASLNAKVVTLQANVTDLVQELTLVKTKEANARLAMEKSAQENVRLTRQIVELESQIETLQEEKAQQSNGDSDQASRLEMDALLRRLDNERQYLKSQLESQFQTKETLEHQLQDLQTQLMVQQQELLASKQQLDHELRRRETQQTQALTDLRDQLISTDNEKQLAVRQVKELQFKLVQEREQQLKDRETINCLDRAVAQYKLQLTAAQDQVVTEQQAARIASERMSSSLMALKNSFHAMEEEKKLKLQHLEDENGQYLTKLAQAQAEMLLQDEKLAVERAQWRKQAAFDRLARTIASKIHSSSEKRQLRALYQWKYESACQKWQVDCQKHHELALEAMEDRLTTEYVEKCDQMTHELHEERLKALKELQIAHEEEKQELETAFADQKQQLEHDFQQLHDQTTQELEIKWKNALASLQNRLEITIRTLENQVETAKSSNSQLEIAFQEAKTQCEQLGRMLEAERNQQYMAAQAHQAALEQERKQWTQKVLSERQELVETHEKQLQSMQQEHQQALKALEEARSMELNQKLEKLEQEFNEKLEKTLETCQLERKTDLETQQQALEAQLSNELQENTKRWQQELEMQQQQHHQTLQTTIQSLESKAQLQVESVLKDLNDKKANAVLQCTIKWQRALEELQERLETEKKMAYASGMQDREAEWQQAATQIKEKQKQELAQVQTEALKAIQAAEERFELKFQAQVLAVQRELETKYHEETAKLQQTWQQAHEAAIQKAEDDADDKIQALTLQWQQQELEKRTQLEQTLHHQFEQQEQLIVHTVREQLIATHSLAVDDLQKQLAERQRTHELTIHELQQVHEHQLTKQDQAWQHTLDTQVARLQTEYERQLHAQEQKLLAEQEQAIAQVQEESEKLIEQVEQVMQELKHQKDLLETQVASLQKAVEQAEDAQFDHEESMKRQLTAAAFQFLKLLMMAKRELVIQKQKLDLQTQNFETEKANFTSQRQQDYEKWTETNEKYQQQWKEITQKHEEMHQILLNYKREELVAFRSASSVLSNEIAIVQTQMNEVLDMKASVEATIEQLQQEAHAIEDQLRQLNVPNDLNMAIVMKKRRLNEEFEALIEKIEKQKTESKHFDKTLMGLRTRKEEKEDELKQLERQLVEILVQQQKQLLHLVTCLRELH